MCIIEEFYTAAFQKKIGLMLDLDGATLHRPPAVHDPVEPDPSYEDSLIRIAEQGCPIVINTGRPEIFVRNVFPNLYSRTDLPFWLATETGARIVGPQREEISIKNMPKLGMLREAFTAALTDYEGGLVEAHKMHSMTISLKYCSEEDTQVAFDRMVTLAKDFERNNDGIKIIPVWKNDDQYIEIVPNDADKGIGTEAILNSSPIFAGTRMFCFGDSRADEDMMSVIRANGGHAFGVGNNLPHHLQDYNFADYKVSQAEIEKAAKLAEGKMTVEQAMWSMPRRAFG